MVCGEVHLEGGEGEFADLEALALRDRLLRALRLVVASAGGGDTRSRALPAGRSRGYELVQSAWRTLEEHLAFGPMQVGDLASRLEVPKRTLYAAFQRWLGLGPHEFQVLLRMHVVRQCLLNGACAPGSVRDAGLRVGVKDPAMLSKAYRRCFGESPRETVRRRRGARRQA